MPPRRAKERLRDPVISEVSLVDAGDNPPALIELFKRRLRGASGGGSSDVSKGKVRGWVDSILEMVGAGVADAEIEKRLFDEVRADGVMEQAEGALMSRLSDLSQSIYEILYGFDPDETMDRQALIAETVMQFAGSIDRDIADIFAGRIMKAFEGSEKPGANDFEKQLAEVFDNPQPDRGGDNRGGGHMDLSKLSKEDRSTVERALKAADQVTVLQAEIDKLKAEKNAGDPDQPDPVRKALDAIADAELRTQLQKKLDDQTAELEKQRESNAALAVEVEGIKKARARESFEKSVGDLTGLSEPREVLVERMWKIEDPETRSAMVKTLEASAEAARRSFSEYGVGEGPGVAPSTAYGKICAAAEELCKSRTDLTPEKARAEVMKSRPDLYREYLAERAN